jgi:hypothetical protein
MTSHAVFAVIAVQRGFEHGAVADRPTGNAGACFAYDSRRLMTEDHGINAARFADTAIGKIMQVRPTDSDCFYRYLNLAWAGIWNVRRVGDTKLPGIR